MGSPQARILWKMNAAKMSDGFMKYARQPWELRRWKMSITTTDGEHELEAEFYLGIWSEQSKWITTIGRLAMTVIALTFFGPQLVRLYGVREDLDTVIVIITQLMSGIVVITGICNSMLKDYKINVMIEKMEKHWKMFHRTSAIVVLEKYAERAGYVVVLFSIFANVSLVIYLAIPTLPIILDFVDPLNETRPKNYVYEAEYGVDPDKYYYFILAHGYAVTIAAINIFVATVIMYILFVEHACALFEVVGFAGMIENMYSGPLAVGIGIVTILMSITSLQVLININHPEMLIRLLCFTIAQVIAVYCNTIPGQRLINHSGKVHKFAHRLEWYDISRNAQKLLILILIRSARPCVLTAGKVYIISLESFGLVVQTSASYFMIFAQLML